MSQENIEQGFELNLEAIQILQNALQSAYLDAYVENFENIIDNYQIRVINGVPDTQAFKRLTAIYQQLKRLDFTPMQRRKLTQLLLLKGTKTEKIQPNHQVTPDSIGMLFVYLIEQLANPKEQIELLDISVGSANLLLTILLYLQNAGFKAEGIGVDIDDTLLAVAAATSEWTKADIQLFHQDGLQELLISPVDFAVSDLPVGYYPQDEKAKAFLCATSKGHSYAHHLLLEQGMKYVKAGGFGLFLIPADLFETEQSSDLKRWISEKVYIQGIIQLPDELFANTKSQKSILLLQNKGEKARQAPEVLLAKVATLKSKQSLLTFFNQFKAWKADNL